MREVNAKVAQTSIDVMAQCAGLEGCEEPEVGLYHMIRMLLDYADLHSLDFDANVSEVRADANL